MHSYIEKGNECARVRRVKNYINSAKSAYERKQEVSLNIKNINFFDERGMLKTYIYLLCKQIIVYCQYVLGREHVKDIQRAMISIIRFWYF